MKNSISDEKLREFGLLIGFGIPLLFGLFLPLIAGHQFRIWTLYIGIPTLIIGFVKPRLLINIYNGWIKLGYILGWINSRIILAIVFILVLQPIAIIMKLVGHDPLRIKRRIVNSYRENKKNHKTNLTKIF